MINRTSKTAFLIIILMIAGCGGYYTKESYYGAKKSDGWSIPFGDNQFSEYKCYGTSIRLMPSSFSAEKTSEALLGVPVLPANEQLKASDSNTEVRIRFEYHGGTRTCSNSDLFIKTAKFRVYPAGSTKYYEIPPENTTYCEYRFNKLVSETPEFLVIISPRVIGGCGDIPKLHIKRETGSIYNFSPW